MNYYEEIKNEFINNEINKKVKNYLINYLTYNTFYELLVKKHQVLINIYVAYYPPI